MAAGASHDSDRDGATAWEDGSMLVRLLTPDKQLVLRGPGELSEATVANLMGLEPSVLTAHRAGISARLQASTDAVLADPEAVERLRALARSAGPRIAVFGDSLSDDLLSWAHVLARALRQLDPSAAPTVANLAVSGDTTADAQMRLPALLALEPTTVLVLIGSNDARRHVLPRGIASACLLSDAETTRNLRAIAAALDGCGTRAAWIAPPPVDERAIADELVFQKACLAWAAVDVEAKAALVRDVAGTVADVRPVDAQWPTLLEDGLHLTPAGHLRMLDAVLRQLRW